MARRELEEEGSWSKRSGRNRTCGPADLGRKAKKAVIPAGCQNNSQPGRKPTTVSLHRVLTSPQKPGMSKLYSAQGPVDDSNGPRPKSSRVLTSSWEGSGDDSTEAAKVMVSGRATLPHAEQGMTYIYIDVCMCEEPTR